MNDSLLTSTNWAEIADKLLDMGTSAYISLAETVKSLAPKMWEMVQRQVYTEAISDVIIILIFCGLAIITWQKFSVFYAKNKNDSHYEDTLVSWMVANSVLSLLTFIFFIIRINLLIKILINPDYYTIQKIMAVINGAGL